MKLLKLMGMAVAIAPTLGLFGCAHYPTREERYYNARTEARRHLERRLAACGYDQPCRARARADYDMRLAEIERYRM